MPPEHDHDHDHDHEHEHEHGGHHHEHVDVSQVPARRLLQALAISSVITVAQVVGGVLAHSLALLSDALHTLTDGIALAVSYAALRLSRRPASEQFTFGLK